jgi:protein phosphatase
MPAAALPGGEEVEALVRQAIAAGNNAVLAEIRRVGYDMGCTLIVTAILGDTAYVANIGDSRAYYLSPDGAIEQITEDQSQVAALVRLGHLDPDAIYTASGNNMILHAIGEEEAEKAAGWSIQPLEPGSYLLLCSDGYWKTLHGAGAATQAIAQAPSLDEAARVLVNDALDHGSDDNTTVVLTRAG